MPSVNDDLITTLQARSAQLDKRFKQLWIPGRRIKIAAGSYDVAYSWRELGQLDSAIANFQRAIDAYGGKIPRKSKDSLAAFKIVASCHNHIGLIHLEADDYSNAIARFDSAIELRRRLKKLFPDDRENQIYLGGALCNIGLATKPTSHTDAATYFEQSLNEIRIPDQPCECSYWDEQRQSWWCEQLEAFGRAAGLAWVDLGPLFIDNAMAGLDAVSGDTKPNQPPNGA